MKLEHTFSVPADLETVWQAMLDPERVAPCMPGATLAEVDGDSFRGSVKVKLGPISLLYKGSGEFLEKDSSARKIVIKASGKDARGNGTASATVTVTVRADGSATAGTVQTDLAITGKPAQFGRGLIAEVGGKILNSFAECLATKLAPDADPPPAPKLSVVADRREEAEPDAAERGEAAEPDAEKRRGAATGAKGRRRAATGAAGRGGAVTSAAERGGADTTGAEGRRGTATGAAGRGGAVTSAAERGGADTTGAEGRRGTATGAAKRRGAAAASAAERREAAATGAAAGAAVGAATKQNPKLTLAEEPEAEPIDLLAYAGPSVAKRVAPVVAVAVAVLFFLIRRRRKR